MVSCFIFFWELIPIICRLSVSDCLTSQKKMTFLWSCMCYYFLLSLHPFIDDIVPISDILNFSHEVQSVSHMMMLLRRLLINLVWMNLLKFGLLNTIHILINPNLTISNTEVLIIFRTCYSITLRFEVLFLECFIIYIFLILYDYLASFDLADVWHIILWDTGHSIAWTGRSENT